MLTFEDVADELVRVAEAGPAGLSGVLAAAPIAIGLPVVALDALFPSHPAFLSDSDDQSHRTLAGVSDFFGDLSVRPDLLGWNTYPLDAEVWLQLTSVGRLGDSRAGLVVAMLCPSGERPDVILVALAGPDQPDAPHYWLRTFVHAGRASSLRPAIEAKVQDLRSVLVERLGVHPST